MFGFNKKQKQVEVLMEVAESEALPQGCEALEDAEFAEVTGGSAASLERNVQL